MNNFSITPIEGDLNPQDKQVMIDGMLAYHASHGHPRKTDTFSIVLKNDNQQFLGCVIVTFLWNGMEIQTLWVEESIRKLGWGRKLMLAAEAEALKRGCTLAYTNTFTWQAPQFYEKLGYTLYGKLENFPAGSELSYFCKKLV